MSRKAKGRKHGRPKGRKSKKRGNGTSKSGKSKGRRGDTSEPEVFFGSSDPEDYRSEKFNEFSLRRIWPGVRRRIGEEFFRRTGRYSPSDVEDIVGEILMNLFKPSNNLISKMVELKTTTERYLYFRNYLYRAAQNRVTNRVGEWFRESARRVPLDDVKIEASGGEGGLQPALENKQLVLRIIQAVSRLPQTEREVFQLHFFKLWHYRRIEAHFNYRYSHNALTKLFRRARTRIRKSLGLGPGDTRLYEEDCVRAFLREEDGDE